ncbi:beta-N-acetylhexosaminidase [Gilvimarinus agarilyticus]|uniref:beta-N-acetylhexosaminidase n=1 Tax=Gilvimarinus agarilyticus TaxID=679259 RepID=UPI0006974663|nr:family 20 glycosylhydrolase [Gilvimarinus agarilyticus]
MLLKILPRGLMVAAMILLHAAPVAQADNSPDFLPLMPYPQTIEHAEGHLKISAPLQFAVADRATPRVKAALQRLNTTLAQRPGVAPEARPILIRLQSLAAENTAPITAPNTELDTADEAYRLTVNGAGITLAARTDVGVLRGLATLAQLTGAAGSVSLPYVVIDDAPRFAWRGLLLDSVRHFISVATIKRQIDGMAAAKLNVLHWHLTDDQGWRFESRAYPKLTELASDGEFYTRQQIKEVIAYAKARGIYVLPEVDMPGHASAIAVAYPELMSAPGPYLPEDRWGVHKPLLNPANEDVYTFAKAILQEVTELFPFGYVHIGGDEVDPEHWQNNAKIQAFMAEQNLADEHALHAYFNGRLASILTGLDRAMIGWDEVLHKDLPAGTLVQSWQGPDALGRAINAGFPALLSTGFYLDQPQSSAYHYRVQLEPQPLDIDTQAHPGEPWRSWRFTMPRKRGSAVAGTVSVISSGDSLRGFVDFNGKSRASVRDLQWQDERLSFALDSWMGPLRANLTIDGDALTGPVLAANAPYTLTGELIASSERDGSELPTAIAKDIISPENHDLLLGGEAALWAEMVDEHNIDVRLWPRGFVVAERLWSSKDLRDADFMYQRLDKVSGWSAEVVGLQHFAQWRDGLAAVVPEPQQALVLNISRALEPAQYYHRHHEKSTHGTYSRRDSLKNLVDVLPAESRATQKFSTDAKRWLSDTDNTAALVAAQAQLSSWQKDAKALRKLLEKNDPANLLGVTQTLQQVSEWGLTILTALAEGKPLGDDERSRAYRELQQAMQIQDEMIVAPARVVMGWLAH